MGYINEWGEFVEDEEGEQFEALENWQGEVEKFAGSVPSFRDVAQAQIQALGESRMGSARTVETTGATPISVQSFVLAEMRIKAPKLVDVVVGTNRVDATKTTSLDVGDGYILVSWGVEGAVQQQVAVDIGMGWRHPFVASFLRVEWFPQDPFPVVGAASGLPVGQARDLTVSAMIGPASYAPPSKLYKTQQGPAAFAAAAVWPFVFQNWTSGVRVCGDAATPNWTAEFMTAAGTVLGWFRIDGNTGRGPTWARDRFVNKPQRAVRCRVTNVSGGNFNNLAMIQELSL